VPVTKDMQRAVFSNFSINVFLIIILLPSLKKIGSNEIQCF